MPDPSPPAAAEDHQHPLPGGVEVLVDTRVRLRFDDLGGGGDGASSSRKKKVSKVPVTGAMDVSVYSQVLDSVEPCLSPPVAGQVVAFLSLNISGAGLPERDLRRYRTGWVSHIQNRHKSCFVLSVFDRSNHTFFYLVYDTLANSVAIVPRAPSYRARDIQPGVILILCNQDQEGDAGDGSYVLAQLIIHTDPWIGFPTNTGTLLTWSGSLLGSSPASGHNRWVEKEREVLLPLPVDKCYYPAAGGRSIPYCSFCAAKAFAIGSTALCWADLETGLLVYRIDEQRFHFIPLPKDCVVSDSESWESISPEQYRCIQGGQEMLKIASLEGYGKEEGGIPLGEVTLTTWSLVRPLHPDGWAWTKDEVCFRMGDLFDDPVYKDELKLQPLLPSYPIISTLKPGVVYLSFVDVDHDLLMRTGELRGVHVLSVDMDSHCRVVSAFKGLPNGATDMIPFACNFSNYQNEKCPRGKEVAYEGDLYLYERYSQEEAADEGALYKEWPSGEEGDVLPKWSSGEGVADKGKSRRLQVADKGKWKRNPIPRTIGGSSKIGLQCVLD